ncbi:MAG: hypothetical protein AAGA99_17020 [Actinomycetota bacterium]
MTTVALTLRRSTRVVHEHAEERLGLPGSLRSRDDVDELLRRWHALFVELRPVLEADGPHGAPPVPQLVDVLAEDLVARGLRPATAPGRPAHYGSAAQRAGAAYVVAGAQLGVRQVAGALPAAWRDDSRYLGGTTAALRSMAELRAWLDRWDDEAVDEIVAGAEATFGRSIEILGAAPWSEPLSTTTEAR